MAAGEDQPQPVVANAAVVVVVVGPVVWVLGQRRHRDLLHLGALGRAAAQPVDRAVARRRREPRAGTARNAIARPALQRQCEGVLRTFLCEVPVAGHPDQGRENAPPFVAERVGDRRLDAGGHSSSQSGLTSIVPNLAAGCLAATSIASSRFLHSIRSNPPTCSLVSANGPSDSTTSPARTCTVVASLTGRSRDPNCRTPRASISSTHAVGEPSGSLTSIDSSTQTSIMYRTATPSRVGRPAGAVATPGGARRIRASAGACAGAWRG